MAGKNGDSGQSQRRKSKFDAQKIRTETNRQRKRAKHMRKHPNDKQTGKLI